MNIDHMHEHDTDIASRGKKRMIIILCLVISIMIIEIVGGIISNSLSLLSDAAHMLVDGLAIGLALFASIVASRPATSRKTYGYYRVEIIAALVNGVILGIITIYIFFQAYNRFINPPEIEGPVMLLVAGIGLVANLTGLLLLRRVSKANLNIKAAFWHIMGDTFSSLGVIIAAMIIIFTGWKYADGIMAVLIGCIILWGSIELIKEAVNVLLEGVPRNIKVEEIISEIKNIAGIIDVHDIHIWSITSGINALSAHLQIDDQKVSESEKIISTVNGMLSGKYNITHTTFQVECSCGTGTVCSINSGNHRNNNIWEEK
jgi:cobalt-zinc-cadmium efflux system protein